MPPPAPVANEPKAPPAARSIPSPTPVVPDDTIAVATSARAPSTRYRKILGIGSDVGVPDGVNVVLSADPFSWLRLSVAGGTNTSALGGRFGLSVIPMGFGPSFNMEAGKYQVTEPNEVIRTFFNVPKWVEPYVQQIGYTYYNAQLGYDYRFGDFIFCLHAGYSYIEGLVRSPKSVVVDSQTGSTVRMKDDGVVQAFTWSAKLGLLYQFAGV